MEALHKHGRPENAAAVEDALRLGHACRTALQDDVAAAKQALQRWQLTTNNEAKLGKALKDGTSVLGLSRAIQVRTVGSSFAQLNFWFQAGVASHT